MEDEGRLAMELLVWGAPYAVPEIVAECEGPLMELVDHDNVCEMLQIAHHHGLAWPQTAHTLPYYSKFHNAYI